MRTRRCGGDGDGDEHATTTTWRFRGDDKGDPEARRSAVHMDGPWGDDGAIEDEFGVVFRRHSRTNRLVGGEGVVEDSG